MSTALAVLAAVAATNAAVISTADGLSVSVYDRAEAVAIAFRKRLLKV